MFNLRRKSAILSCILVLAMLCSIITVQPVFAAGAIPYHISIVMTESPQDSILIAWETNDTSVKHATVQVVEASDPNGFDSDKVVVASNGSVTVSGSIAYSKVLVTGLKAGTQYIFRCGDGTDEGWSGEGTFKTAPETQEPFTFLYLSDPQINLSAGSQDASKTRQMFKDAWEQFGDDLSFSLITGDFTDYNSQSEWNELFDMAGNLFSNAVTVPVLGNHDRTFGTNYTKYKFPDPPTDDDDPTKGIEYTYAFEYGAALFMVIRVDDSSMLQTIAEWMKEQVNNSDKPWKIVAFHEALYSAGSHLSEQANARKVLSPVFDRLGIDLVLQGHDHTYSRSIVAGDGSKVTPVSVDGSPNKVFDPDAPIYYQTISGATRFYSPGSYSPGSGDPLLPNYQFIDFKVDIQADSSSADGNKMCYTGITVSNEAITLTTYYTTTKTLEKGHLETYTIYNTNPAYVSRGSEWKYLDDGSEPDPEWKDPDFDDSSWKTGLAPFGYPEDEERPIFGAIKTLTDYGTDTNNRYMTTYFRKTFDVSDPSILANKGSIRLGIDDGVVLYLNGQEIGRYNVSDDGVDNEDEPASAENLPVLTLDGEDLSHIRKGTNVLAAEVHQWSERSSDLYWDMELTVETKAAPRVQDSVILEADGDTVSIGGPGGGKTVQLLPSGRDDSNQDVNLTDATICYETDMPEVIAISPEGVVSVKNKAYHNVTADVWAIVSLRGKTVTSNAIPLRIEIASERVLLDKNSEWRYLDDGSDQGTLWRERTFDDSAWKTGNAPLGYPATFNSPDFGTVSTKVNDGGSSKYITTYFRKKITIDNPDDYDGPGTIILGVDDGVVLYLNGVEIARFNMPDGAILSSTKASSASQNSQTVTMTLDDLPFAEGENVFAAEVHQQSSSSSDLFWDMQLKVEAPAEKVELEEVTLSIDKNELVAGISGDRNKAKLSVSGLDSNNQNVDLSQALVTYCTDRPDLISIDSDGVVTAKYLPSLDPTAEIWAVVQFWNQTVPSDSIEVNIQFEQEVLLVDKGEEWLYSDLGDIKNSQWMNLDFDDSGWKTGSAPLGYPNTFESSDFGRISTVVGYGSSSSKYTTTYFRKKFSIDNLSGFTKTGTIKFGVDDGVVLYLNGQEIARYNMPSGTISYSTKASNALQNSETVTVTLDNLPLVKGENVIAAEVHQQSSSSSDLFWDMTFHAGKEVKPEIIHSAMLTADNNKYTMAYGGIGDPESIQLNITGKDILGNNLDLTGAIVQYFTYWSDLINIDANGLVTFKKDPPVNTTVQIWAYVTLWGKTVVSNVININVIRLSQQTLIDSGMEWQYFDEGAVQDEDWNKVFDTWSSGPAPLGFDVGDPPADEWPGFGLIKTTVGYGGNSSNKNPTTYFRKTFNITDTRLIAGAGIIECGLDDGAVIYLNGHEIARYNMPEGTVSYETLTPTNADEELEEPIKIRLDAEDLAWLKAGENLIAVEVHQCRAASTDLYWDMRLIVDTYCSVDIVPPEISLNGDNPLLLKLNQKYIEPGAKATDIVDGGIDAIFIDSSSVDTSKPGTYMVTYRAVDKAGNIGTATRVVIVDSEPIEDTEPPVITLLGDNPMELTVGESYVEFGATAEDNVDGEIDPASIEIDSSAVDTSKPGTYTVFYKVKDAAGNEGKESRTVIVKDKKAPVITLNGSSTIILTAGQEYEELGAAATDDVDGPVTVTITGTVDTSKAGTYTITYTATDTAGNTATATRVVIVSSEPIEDTTPPAIELIGEETIYLTVGDTFTDPGAKATDDVDGSVAVTSTGTVDTSKAGTYTITYTATDTAGNTATATRTVIVKEAPVADTTAPVITLNGNNPMELTVGDIFTDPGASAIDDVDGTVDVVASGMVDTSKAGTYTITYTATDTAGNTATATRTVKVKEKSTPADGGGSGGGGGAGGGGGGAGGGGSLIIPDEKIPQSGAPKGEITPTPKLNSQGISEADLSLEDIDKALYEIGTKAGAAATIGVNLGESKDAKGYLLNIPAKALKGKGRTRFDVKTPYGSILIPDNVLDDSVSDTSLVGIRITRVDPSALEPDLRSMVGNRPVIELTMWIDGKPYAWNNPAVPVIVTLDYQPTGEELENPEHLVIVNIDGEGKTHAVPTGNYDPDTGKLTFSVTHFSRFTVSYVYKTFTDITGSRVRNKIEVMASKGIIGGTSATTYSPQANITRADFLYLLFRAMGIELKATSNFDDIKPGIYYYDAVGIAKAFGITSGTGNNRFSPDAYITRQDMMVMAAKALRIFNVLDKSADLSQLDKLRDKDDIAGYAREPIALLTGEGLVPADPVFRPGSNTSREEVADMIYNIYFYMRKNGNGQE